LLEDSVEDLVFELPVGLREGLWLAPSKSRLEGKPGGALVFVLERQEERKVPKPGLLSFDEIMIARPELTPFVTEAGKCPPHPLTAKTEAFREVRVSRSLQGGLVSRTAKRAQFGGIQEPLVGEELKTHEMRRTGEGATGVVGRISTPDGMNREHLPEGAARVLQKVDEAVSGWSEISRGKGPGERGGVKEKAG